VGLGPWTGIISDAGRLTIREGFRRVNGSHAASDFRTRRRAISPTLPKSDLPALFYPVFLSAPVFLHHDHKKTNRMAIFTSILSFAFLWSRSYSTAHESNTRYGNNYTRTCQLNRHPDPARQHACPFLRLSLGRVLSLSHRYHCAGRFGPLLIPAKWEALNFVVSPSRPGPESVCNAPCTMPDRNAGEQLPIDWLARRCDLN
jgi:hypothetical protein